MNDVLIQRDVDWDKLVRRDRVQMAAQRWLDLRAIRAGGLRGRAGKGHAAQDGKGGNYTFIHNQPP